MCSVCERLSDDRDVADTLSSLFGPVTQSGRVSPWHGGSRGFKSLQVHQAEVESLGFMLGGLVAGEGSFCVARVRSAYADGSERMRFVFGITMASRDGALLEQLQAFLGCGSINDRAPAKRGWQPTSSFVVTSQRAHLQFVIPSADRYVLASAKREQFLRWKEALFTYRALHPNRWGAGRSTCRVEGCKQPTRGQGLCRSHYRATGY